MVLWITAIRRCAVSAPGRPLHCLTCDSGRESTPEKPLVAIEALDESFESSFDDASTSDVVLLRLARNNVLHVNSWRNPEAEIKLINFLKTNRSCAECKTHEQLKSERFAYQIRNLLINNFTCDRWISTSLGITLCEACAGAHRYNMRF